MISLSDSHAKPGYRDLLQIAKSQNLMNTGDATVDYNLDQLLDDFFETWGMPKESELALLSQLHRVRMSAINGWCT